MTSDDDNADDDAATSAGAGPSDETTTIVPPPTEAAPELAWSVDDDEPAPVHHPPWHLAWAQSAAVLLIAGVIATVIALAGWTWIANHRQQAAPPTTAAPASTIPIQVAPPTTTVAAPASAPTAAEPPDPIYDERFLDSMRALGLSIPQQNTAAALRWAHELCRLIRQGKSVEQVNRETAVVTGIGEVDSEHFVASEQVSYPNCS